MIRRVLAVLVLVGGILVGGASAASAIDIGVCNPTAPAASVPTQGVIGALDTRPAKPSATLTPETIWSNGGLGGMNGHTYDLGCAWQGVDVSFNLARASFNVERVNVMVTAGTILSAITTSLESKAWEPTWIVAFLGDFLNRAVGLITTNIWVPFVTLGLIVASILLVLSVRRNDVSSVANGAAWTLLVIGICGFVIASPILASEKTQELGSNIVRVLNDREASENMTLAEANADQVAGAVHYQDYLRRTFGDSNSEAANKFGIRLLAASRLSWNEADQVGNDPDKMKAMQEAKAKDYVKVMSEIKAFDENGAYKHAQSHPDVDAAGNGGLGLAFSLAVNLFRIMADGVMVAGVIALALVGIVWIVAAAYTVTPHGVPLGHQLLSTAGMCVGHIVACAIGVWLFIMYANAAMAPGMSAAWSLILLIIGSVLFWSILRPDKKMLSLFTMGRTSGASGMARFLRGMATAVVAGRTAGAAAAAATPKPTPDAPEPEPDDAPPPPPMPTIGPERALPAGTQDSPPMALNAPPPPPPPPIEGVVVDHPAGREPEPEPEPYREQVIVPSHVVYSTEEPYDDSGAGVPAGSTEGVRTYQRGDDTSEESA